MKQLEVFNELLAKDMNRKEFLAYLGGTALAVVGVTGLLKTLTKPVQSGKTTGYGGGVYGGKKV